MEQFSVSPRPLSFGFGTKRFGAKGLGPGLDKNAQSRGVLELSVQGDFRYASPNAILKLFLSENGAKSVSNDP